MKREHKKYRRPRKLYDKARIEEENVLVEKYGLKSKREIWKAEAAIDNVRRRAKELITAEQEKQKIFFKKLSKKGFKAEKIADILALTKEDWLKRRLQSIVAEKKIASTPKQARQFIVHKNIAINNNIINIPSYIVSTEEEKDIRFTGKSKKIEKTKNG